MGHTQGHGPLSVPGPPERVRKLRLILLIALLPFVAATAVGVVLLWPEPYAPDPAFGDPFAQPGVEFRSVAVRELTTSTCATFDGDITTCGDALVTVDGEDVTIEIPPGVVETGLGAGARIYVVTLPQSDGSVSYNFAEVDRGAQLGLLAAAFAVLVVLVARLRGFAALVGLAIAYVVLRQFMLPALLAGEPAIPVAVVGSSLIMFVALYVAHGVSLRTTTAVLGTMFGLTTTALLGWLMTEVSFLTGAGGDDELLLSALAPDLDLRGVLLAGLVLAGLGVLNDVTVTQASSVWELHDAHPTRGTRHLFASAMRIGRDHIASSVYTLVFAYAGASLPIFLLIAVYQRPVLDVASTEAIAEEIVSTLVGATGLVLAVPLTTLLGAVVVNAARMPSEPGDPGEGESPTAAEGADPQH